MFINSIAIWYSNEYRADKTQMAMLYPQSSFKNEQSVIEWAMNQRKGVTTIIAYDAQANVVVQWSKS